MDYNGAFRFFSVGSIVIPVFLFIGPETQGFAGD